MEIKDIVNDDRSAINYDAYNNKVHLNFDFDKQPKNSIISKIQEFLIADDYKIESSDRVSMTIKLIYD
jgi:hypothetical protein